MRAAGQCRWLSCPAAQHLFPVRVDQTKPTLTDSESHIFAYAPTDRLTLSHDASSGFAEHSKTSETSPAGAVTTQHNTTQDNPTQHCFHCDGSNFNWQLTQPPTLTTTTTTTATLPPIKILIGPMWPQRWPLWKWKWLPEPRSQFNASWSQEKKEKKLHFCWRGFPFHLKQKCHSRISQ